MQTTLYKHVFPDAVCCQILIVLCLLSGTGRVPLKGAGRVPQDTVQTWKNMLHFLPTPALEECHTKSGTGRVPPNKENNMFNAIFPFSQLKWHWKSAVFLAVFCCCECSFSAIVLALEVLSAGHAQLSLHWGWALEECQLEMLSRE